MLGRKDPQGELFRPDHLYLDHVGKSSFYAWLGDVGPRMFKDESFSGLYREGGRPSVPPSQLCVALLLQTHDGVSDDEAIQRSAFDLRWKVALRLNLEEKLCAKSTLQLFRAKLVLHEKYQRLFEASVTACREAGLLKRRKLEVAIDTTPVFGRGAVKDTYNLISDAVRRVVNEVAALKGLDRDELAATHGLSRHFSSSFKGSFDVDWTDPEQRRAVVAQLVADAYVALELTKQALRGHRRAQTRSLREAKDLLSELLLQDIDEDGEDSEGPQIRQGTRKDRIISTTDPEMRHGHKSHSKNIEGYKASVVAETKSGVILATDVRGANSHDQEGAPELIEEAGVRAEQAVKTALGDTAYGNMEVRERLAEMGVEVVAKAPPVPRRRGKFSFEDFQIDRRRGVARCPAGRRSIRRDRVGTDGWKYVFSRNDCNPCPLRSHCTTAKIWPRMVQITSVTDKLQRLRRHQKTKRFRKRYRRRIVVEHRIARLKQCGIRKARYFGKAKTKFQIAIAAAVANLGLAAALSRLQNAVDGLRAALTDLVGLPMIHRSLFMRMHGAADTAFQRLAGSLKMATSRPDL